ncbi:hypothetical protein SAMN05216605_107112 [Pseudomonas abietaniphila]|uniref:Uncharacterized protein n=1 Tax=Pseudomonas abietaniphila TaxID=89065 RepID=A0A1G8DQ42_9PSED|nr:hypothetical protein SAMN05216605_107112 [Pseudomonas abietaniphila]
MSWNIREAVFLQALSICGSERAHEEASPSSLLNARPSACLSKLTPTVKCSVLPIIQLTDSEGPLPPG